MTFTLSFSKNRAPLIINGLEATLQVEANSRSESIYHKDTVDFCNEHQATVRSVSNG